MRVCYSTMSSSMETDSTEDPPGRWRDVQKLLTRGSPLAHPDFEPSDQTHQFMRSVCKVLVVGAGGLGCELLKDLAMLGFTKIHVIDMDTIDISNLNRQFLFSDEDVGKPKAEVAAQVINERVAGAAVVPHYCRIQDFDMDFYRQFHIIVCGLDSIIARRWMNGMVLSLLKYDENGELDQSSIIPLIDGGTEGFKGNARVILPGISACIDCTLDLYPPQINYPLCTIATKPRLPEHCVEYVKILQWTKEKPFEGVPLDGDNPDHILWIFERAEDRAKEYGIQGVTYRLTQGVVKRIIPAVASTNAAIAGICATEVFKLATSCSRPLQNYMVFNDTDGVYTYTFEAEKKEDCASCSTKPIYLTFVTDTTLQQVYDYLKEDQKFLMKAPSITTVIDGKNKTLYMPTLDAVEKATRHNLKQKLTDLGVVDGHQLVVADATTPKTLSLIIKLEQEMEPCSSSSTNQS